MPGVLALVTPKRLLGTAIGAGLYGAWASIDFQDCPQIES